MVAVVIRPSAICIRALKLFEAFLERWPRCSTSETKSWMVWIELPRTLPSSIVAFSFSRIFQTSGNKKPLHAVASSWASSRIYMYICICLQHYRIHMDISNSKNYLGIKCWKWSIIGMCHTMWEAVLNSGTWLAVGIRVITNVLHCVDWHECVSMWYLSSVSRLKTSCNGSYTSSIPAQYKNRYTSSRT